MNKILFLDIDGVLNSSDSEEFADKTKPWFCNEVSDYHLKELSRIIAETSAKIVLTSSWRLYHPLFTGFDKIEDSLIMVLEEKFKLYDLSVFDVTPELCGQSRGREIESWLSNHSDVSVYVILDDEFDILSEQKDRVVRTTLSHGLTKELADLVIEKFKSC